MPGFIGPSGVITDSAPRRSGSAIAYCAKFNKIFLCLSLFLVLSTLLLACGSAPTPPPKVKIRPVTPTATPIPAGTLLYEANWSFGLDSWQATQGWKHLGKNLQTEPMDKLSITVPYQPQVSDYAIDVRLQIVYVAANGGYVSIDVDKQPGRDGYKASVQNLLEAGIHPNGSHPQVQAYIDPLGSMERGSFETSDFEPGTQWHDFRVEVRGSLVSLFIDDRTISNATSTKTNFLSAGPIHLTGSKVILRVGLLSITAL
ncbi:hypothetical protein KDA_64960 [Dictyobacter alpinus]|uniref:3-keto-disaccharide hydrolase domain-containing protein n=1 Tax=Dictyobacter alpinus TaxID=2014873 RepID=A0A402BIF5_9CHLR|nr:hypothetical protein [Dictyobacter alpinus]GCE31012.1 hypothetical protein KDA_64960 [Dictyobacter alpinus]